MQIYRGQKYLATGYVLIICVSFELLFCLYSLTLYLHSNDMINNTKSWSNFAIYYLVYKFVKLKKLKAALTYFKQFYTTHERIYVLTTNKLNIKLPVLVLTFLIFKDSFSEQKLQTKVKRLLLKKTLKSYKACIKQKIFLNYTLSKNTFSNCSFKKYIFKKH